MCNDFTNKKDKCKLLCDFTFTQYLIRLYNLHALHLLLELLLLDKDTSSANKHAKYYLDIAAAHSFIIDEILFVPLGS